MRVPRTVGGQSHRPEVPGSVVAASTEQDLLSIVADDVRFQIRAFSRPATLPARAGGPLSRLVQQYVTDRYVEALRRLSRK